MPWLHFTKFLKSLAMLSIMIIWLIYSKSFLLFVTLLFNLFLESCAHWTIFLLCYRYTGAPYFAAISAMKVVSLRFFELLGLWKQRVLWHSCLMSSVVTLHINIIALLSSHLKGDYRNAHNEMNYEIYKCELLLPKKHT